MTIRCPHCGRDGRLPDELAEQRQILRCRKCQGRFTAHTQQPVGVGAAPALERMGGDLARFQSGGSFLDSLDDDDDELPPIVTGPGDSNYEISVALEGELDDSQFELPAVGAIKPEPAVAEPEAPAPDPQLYDLINSWSLIGLYVALAVGGPALLVIGVCLVRAFLDGLRIDRYTTALMLGFVGTLAFLFVTSATTALNLLLVDLARNTRRLRLHAERAAGE